MKAVSVRNVKKYREQLSYEPNPSAIHQIYSHFPIPNPNLGVQRVKARGNSESLSGEVRNRLSFNSLQKWELEKDSNNEREYKRVNNRDSSKSSKYETLMKKGYKCTEITCRLFNILGPDHELVN